MNRNKHLSELRLNLVKSPEDILKQCVEFVNESMLTRNTKDYMAYYSYKFYRKAFNLFYRQKNLVALPDCVFYQTPRPIDYKRFKMLLDPKVQKRCR